ncbi:hypothetical protein SAMD00019534_002920 [Acytostelium subglobosum LB1]|uniref:hypothetical protein n=1 Tax=Acytostelium subglobosum LB1 TaxID=1410327 RepID=UPI000644D26D|nr:hypothetical protein SAMD00019534_002920 [Acytostelium subglobosum LB1]GAM17117.1 hypothetical protein SAMD00019534_002920 [Acytostelium subglobosum LB1]|eukprot:XP_012759179.1 hypothetical protein SAMD00019534_002920 [Acytostelium subglobosum LB1]
MNSFTSINVIDKINQKIECIDTWDYKDRKKLLLGTYEGLVIVYEVAEKMTYNAHETPGNVSMKLFDTKALSKKPISQMNVLEPYNALVILTDGEIKVFDLVNNYNQKAPLNKAKGCSLYAISQNGSYTSLCAAVKKKLITYAWDGTDFVEAKEFNIPDTPKTIDYRDNYIVVGFKKSYNIINTIDGSVFNSDTDKISFLTFFQDKEFLIVKHNLAFFINCVDGKPNRKYGLTWSDSPVSLTIKYPFIISIEPKQIEVQIVPESKGISQTMFLQGCKSIAAKHDIYVASTSTVWRLNPVPTLDLVDQLVANQEFETAINVLNIAPDTLAGKREKLAKTRINAAHAHFAREQYASAMELFLAAQFDPLKVIAQYPGFLPPLLQDKIAITTQVKDIEKNDTALSALETFLVGIRKELQKPEKPPYNLNPPELANSGYDLPTLIDTTILKIYIKLKPNLISIFFNLKNCLHIEESQRVLKEERKFAELVLFYQSKAMHREALTLLAKNGDAKETINYLCQLGPQHLSVILEHSKWVLQKSTQDAMFIFTTERKEELPPDQVIAHLEKYASNHLMEYLEYIINRQFAQVQATAQAAAQAAAQGLPTPQDKPLIFQQDKAPIYHNSLILEYQSKIMTLIQGSLVPRVPGETVAGSEPGLLGQLRTKLINFLQTSKYYLPEKLLSRFPTNDLYEERAILLSRISRHDQALAIYAHKLMNFKMAEEYCDRNYNKDKDESKDVYLSLLNVYLKPEASIKPQIEPALKLLNKHYRSIDTPKALGLLPLNIPIQELYPFFEAVIRDNTRIKRESQVVKNLLKAEHAKIKEELIHLRAGVIKITDDLICPYCNKRFVGTNAFAAQPNGVAIHYVCFQNQQASLKNSVSQNNLNTLNNNNTNANNNSISNNNINSINNINNINNNNSSINLNNSNIMINNNYSNGNSSMSNKNPFLGGYN